MVKYFNKSLGEFVRFGKMTTPNQNVAAGKQKAARQFVRESDFFAKRGAAYRQSVASQVFRYFAADLVLFSANTIASLAVAPNRLAPAAIMVKASS